MVNLPVLADITQLVVAIIIILLSIVGSLVQGRQEAKKRQQRRRPPQRPGRGPDMIEDLLKQANEEGPAPRGGRPVRSPRVAQPAVVEAEIVDESIAEHVAHTFARPAETSIGGGRLAVEKHEAGTLSEQRESLATRAAQQEKSAAGQRRRRTRRRESERPSRVSGLATSSAPEPVAAAPATADSSTTVPPDLANLLQALTTPEGLATGIVLKEILERPEARWRR